MNDGGKEGGKGGREAGRPGGREGGRALTQARWSGLSITLGETLSHACCMDCSSTFDS